jgi:hypothetical protein
MKKLSLSSTFLALVCFTSSSVFAADENLIAINVDQVKKLSQETFQIEVDTAKTVHFKGQWPQICSQSATVYSYHSPKGMSLRILVNNKCYGLITEKPQKLSKLTKAPLSTLKVKGIIRDNELVYLESAEQKLDLSLPFDSYYSDSEGVHQTSPFKNPPSQHTDKTIFGEKANGASQNLDGSVRYRRCNPDDYGINNPIFCNGRYGLDLNADFQLGDSTKLRGTTQFDVTTPNGSTDGITGQAGVRLDLLYEFQEPL